MTLVLPSRKVTLVARVSRALISPALPTVEAWWADTSQALLELFDADHAMCALPGIGMLAMHIDDSALARITTVAATPSSTGSIPCIAR